MMVVRPIRSADLAALNALARSAGVGMTTLPANADELQKRVDAAVASFAGEAARADEIFLFVMEDTATGEVVGTCGIASAVGLRQPWYSYRVGTVVHASQELNLFNQTPTLFLSNDHTGHTELCSLFLAERARAGKNGQLLSKSRFLYLAAQKAKFSEKIIAELRGVVDDAGRSPFWESLGRHFFSIDYSQADYLTGVGNKSFVAELMPRHPLYSSFLSAEAQAVIGKVHPQTAPAQRMLAAEGFRYAGYVDIFDAGPTVECALADIGAVSASKVLPCRVDPSTAPGAATTWLVANTSARDFRATLAATGIADGALPLDPGVANALGVADGQDVIAVPLAVADRH